MNHVAERPTSFKPPLPVRRQHNDRLQSDRPGGVSFNRKVRLFEGNGQVPEDAEETDGFAPLRRRQPKAITPEQKRWTQIETSENTSLWSPPPNTPTRSKQKTLQPTPSPRYTASSPTPAPRLLSPSTPTPAPRLSSPVAPNRTFINQENSANRTCVGQENAGDGVKKRPKPKPRARSGIQESVLDKDLSDGLHVNGESSTSHLNSESLTTRLNIESLTSDLNKEFSTADLNNDSPTSHVNREPVRSDLKKEYLPSNLSHDSSTSHVNKSSMTHARTLPYKLVSYHTKSSDPVIYANSQTRYSQKMAYNFSRGNPPEPQNIRPRTQSHELLNPRPRTQFNNATHNIAGNDSKLNNITGNDSKPPQRPRASTDLVNGRVKEDIERTKGEDNRPLSVLELAQSFGELKSKDRPKKLGSPLRNNNLVQSNPDILSDESDDTISPEPGSPVRKVHKLQKRLSKSLSDFNLIDMPEMDPSVYTSGGKLKLTPPERPTTGPSHRPVSELGGPRKPKRTYEHDAYVLRKSQKGLPKSGVKQTQSAAPAGKAVTPLVLPSSINAKKRHVYDDVPLENAKEEEKQEREYVLVFPSPPSSPVPPCPNKTSKEDDFTSPNARPKSSMSAINKPPRRGKLQRTNRIERSISTEDILEDKFKISGEYANPEVTLLSKMKKERSRQKPEYSETNLKRSNSDESLNRKSRPPVEDSAGYTVPGSHLWSSIPDKKEEEQKSQVKLALHNVVSTQYRLYHNH